MLIKAATDLRFACAPEFALGLAAAMAKPILGGTLAMLSALESLACLTKIYNVAHFGLAIHEYARDEKAPDPNDVSAQITTIRWRALFASDLRGRSASR
jgi:hypothetical protein